MPCGDRRALAILNPQHMAKSNSNIKSFWEKWKTTKLIRQTDGNDKEEHKLELQIHQFSMKCVTPIIASFGKF